MILTKIYKNIILGADTKFITIKFLKIFLAKTLILWLAILIAMEGRGTYVQFPIFYSWLALPAFLELPHESAAWNIYSYSVPIAFFAVSTILSLILWFRKEGRKILRNVLIVHFVGVAVCIWVAEYYSAPLSTKIEVKLLGGAVALFVSYFFWRIFFRIVDYRVAHPRSVG